MVIAQRRERLENETSFPGQKHEIHCRSSALFQLDPELTGILAVVGTRDYPEYICGSIREWNSEHHVWRLVEGPMYPLLVSIEESDEHVALKGLAATIDNSD